jgi:hypothetical protein
MFTGSKPHAPKKRNLPVSRRQSEIEEDDVLSPRTTKRQRSTTAAAKKKTTLGPTKLMDQLTKNQFLVVRGVNPYVVEKNVRLCPNPYFNHQNQERIYNEIYGSKEFACCPQWSIRMEKLDSDHEYFGEAKAICEELGIVPLIIFNHPFSREVICQFYVTVQFDVDENGVLSLSLG